MKNTMIVSIVPVGLGTSVVAQAPQQTVPATPNLSDLFAKTGLKALQAMGDFKGTGSLSGPAKDALEAARVEASSTSTPETLMFANLLNFAIMRSADNVARENVVAKATAKLEHDGVRPNASVVLGEVKKDRELSAELDSINKRESECSAVLEKAFRGRIAIPLPGVCSSSK